MKKTKTPTTVTLVIFTTITVLVWIFFDIYRILKKTPVINVDPKILEPLNPNLDQNSLNKIELRKYYGEESLNIPIPTNPPTVTPTIEESSQPTETPATQSAEQIQ